MKNQTVGQFTFSDGKVAGPEAYMKAQGSALLASISAKRSLSFPRILEGVMSEPRNAHLDSLDQFVLAILITVQTDYAGWKGMAEFNSGRAVAMGRA